MTKLNIGTTTSGKPFSIPLDAVTSTFAILAKKGSGKSYTASVIAEEMLKAEQQIVVLDPTGAWSGIQSSADGKHEGFAVVIFGGDRGNVPLQEGAGEIIATAVVEKKFSAVLDLSLFRKAQSHRFVTSFIETLYRLNRDPVHVFIDEADDLCPQKPFGNEAQTVGAIEDLVKRGRRKGIGCTLITQRPADIAKNVLTQADTLIALRLNHKLDLNPIEAWIRVHADEKLATRMMDSLPSLPTGTAWIWTPERDIFDCVKIRTRETFDSGATPKPGEKVRTPQKLAAIDIARLGDEITRIGEEAKANDPRALKTEVLKLGAENLKLKAELAKAKPVDSDKIAAAIKKEGERLTALFEKETARRLAKTTKFFALLRKNAESTLETIKAFEVLEPEAPVQSIPERKPQIIREQAPRIQRTNSVSDSSLSKCERAILIVLAQLGSCSKRRVAMVSGYSVTSGGFNNALSMLRTKGFITGRGDDLGITPEGVDALGTFDPLPTGSELQRYWVNKLAKCEGAILQYLIEQYPNGANKSGIAEATKYQATSGGFNNSLSRLRTLELIEGRGDMKATSSLFD